MPEQRTYQGHVYQRNSPTEPWQLAGPAQSAGPSVVFQAPPDPYKQAAEARAAEDQAIQRASSERADAAARRAELEWNATHNVDGTPKAKVVSEKPLPQWAAKPYEDQIGIYGGVNRGLNTFKDEYAGNALTGSAENTIQGMFSSFGSEGQRDWWAQFGSTDNVIRNDLFGATLTESEKAAYAATTVSPSMDPKEVRRNLQSRRDILESALRRRTNFLKAQGYSKDAIEALAGEYADRLGAAIVAPKNPPSPGDDKGTLVPGDVANKITESGLTPEQQAAYDAFNAANPRATADQLRAFTQSLGIPLENADEIVKARDQGGGVMPAASGIVRPPNISDVRGQGGVAEGADAFMRGAADTLSLGFADEIGAAGRTVFGSGTMDENLRRERAIDRYDAENSPWLRGAGQLAGGLAFPIGRGAKTVGELAGVGGATGAGYGFGSGETLGDRFIGAGTGGVAGAALGATFGKLGDMIRARRGPPPSGGGGGATPPVGPDLADVAARMGVRPSPATVGGAPAEVMQIGLGNAPGSMNPVREGVANEIEALAGYAKKTAARMGAVGTPQQAGEILARGASVADRAQGRLAGSKYDARTAMMGGENAPVTMDRTRMAIQGAVGDFRSNEVVGDLLTHPLVKKLEGADINELTLNESTELLSEARRVLRRARESKQPGRLIGQLRKIEQSIEDDVMRAAQASDAINGRGAGEGAAAMQRQGDSIWADRMMAQKRELKRMLASRNDDVNTPSENVYSQLFRDMNEEGGNLVRLRKTLDRLPKRARDVFSASAFDDLGKAKPNAQNAERDAWSFETFMTNWAKISDDAKRVVFQGRGVDREISDIVRYAGRLRELNKARNFSNTAPTLAMSAYVSALVTSLFTGGFGAALAGGAAYPAMNVVGRAFMATPAMRSWLRSALQGAARGNESQVQTLIRRLPSLAAKNPAISGEIAQFEQYLIKVANDNGVSRAAASPERKNEQDQ